MGDTIRDAVQVPPQVVRLREKGQFTVPAKIRKSMGIQEDDLLTVFQWGNSFIAVQLFHVSCFNIVSPEVVSIQARIFPAIYVYPVSMNSY